jgi:ABC-2 type transport system permease protein
MMTLIAALRKEILEQQRTYRMVIALAVFLIFGLLSPLLAKLAPEILKLVPGGEAFVLIMPPPTVVDAITQYVKNLSQFGIVLAWLMGMGAVAQEKEKGTAAIILSKPMPRSAFILAKYGALKLTLSVGVLAAAIAGYYYTLLLFEPLPVWGWLALNLLLLAFLLVHVALTLFCSSLVRSQGAAAALAIAGTAVLGLLASLPGVGDYMPAKLLTWGAGSVSGDPHTYWQAVWVSAGIIVVSLAGAWLALEQQEL